MGADRLAPRVGEEPRQGGRRHRRRAVLRHFCIDRQFNPTLKVGGAQEQTPVLGGQEDRAEDRQVGAPLGKAACGAYRFCELIECGFKFHRLCVKDVYKRLLLLLALWIGEKSVFSFCCFIFFSPCSPPLCGHYPISASNVSDGARLSTRCPTANHCVSCRRSG